MIKRKNKYRNKWTWCRQGRLHQSAGEANYCNELEWQCKAGLFKDYKSQVTFELHGYNGDYIGKHIVDFIITNNNDNTEVREYKGEELPFWKWKRKMFEKEYPDIPYIVVKERK